MKKIILFVYSILFLKFAFGGSEWNVISSYNYAYLDILIDANQLRHSNLLIIESSSHPIFKIELADRPIYHEIYDNSFYKVDTPPFPQSKCFIINVPPFLSFDSLQLKLFTHFYLNQHVFLTIYTEKGKILEIENAKALALPIPYYKVVKPESTDDGKQYYGNFNEAYLNRNLSFQSQPESDYAVRILTFPRSGTHLMARTIADIFGEYVILFPRFFEQLWGMNSEDFKNGEIRSGYRHSRLSVSHYVPAEHMSSRIVLVMRDPVEAFESGFSSLLHQNLKCKHEKANLGYEKEPDFKNYVAAKLSQLKAIKKNLYDFPSLKLYIRFEDLINNSLQTFCEVITFVDAFPCELSVLEKVKHHLLTEGLTSSYKTVVHSSSDVLTESYLEVYNRWGNELVGMVFEDRIAKKLIYFYDYQERFFRFLGLKPGEEDFEASKFYDLNQDALKEVLTYQHDVKLKVKTKLFWEKWDLVPRSINKAVENKTFYKYRACQEQMLLGSIQENVYQILNKKKMDDFATLEILQIKFYIQKQFKFEKKRINFNFFLFIDALELQINFFCMLIMI